jgi:phosphoribosylanthranilate isomerase
VGGVPRVKICGLTSLGDAQHAVDHGAWALGMIFWPGSKRACAPDEAARITGSLRRHAETVGVFVDQPLDEVVAHVEQLRLSMVQLHGGEGPAYAEEVARRTGAKVIKALRIRTGQDVVRTGMFRFVDLHLLDTYVEGEPGGTGRSFDWSLAAERHFADTIPLVLSGGLTPENVAEAVEQVAPYAVDVASGVEAAPGVKDPEKVAAFLAAAGARPKPGPPRPVPVPPAKEPAA